MLANSAELFQALHKPECGHGSNFDYQPYVDEDGVIRFPAEEEAQYPQGLVQAYAVALKHEATAPNWWPSNDDFRVQQISEDLSKYSRFDDEDLRHKVASKIQEMEADLVSGNENQARYDLLRHGHYGGTDIRFAVEPAAQREMVPIPPTGGSGRTRFRFDGSKKRTSTNWRHKPSSPM